MLQYLTFEFTPVNIGNLLIDNINVQNYAGNPQVNNDLKMGSPSINAINSYYSSIPRISMQAKESSPVHWRLFGSTLCESEGLSPNDQDFVNKINSARSVYHASYLLNLSLATISSVLGIFNPSLFAMVPYYTNCAVQWKRGRDWFDSSEGIWNSLTKSSRKETIHVWICGWICLTEPDWDGFLPKNIPEPCDEWEWGCEYVPAYVLVHHPSDGFIPEYSQKISNLPSGNYYEILNANHIEVRNMSHKGESGDNTRKEFDKIWKRPSDDFFYTPTR